MKNKFLRAASVIEYAVLLAVVASAVIGMKIYLKRAISGRWKNSIDIFGYGRQYDPASTGNGPATPAPPTSPTPTPTPTPTPGPPGPTTFVPSGTLPIGTPGVVTIIIPTTAYLTAAQERSLANQGIIISGRSDYDPSSRIILEQSTTGYVTQAQRNAINAVQNAPNFQPAQA